MTGTSPDPRAHALAAYLRERAAAFSLSADATGEQHITDAGMALLDAAAVASVLPAGDHRLVQLSEAGRFETMPEGTSRFVETPDVRAVLQRPIGGTSMSGAQILTRLVATACDVDPT